MWIVIMTMWKKYGNIIIQYCIIEYSIIIIIIEMCGQWLLLLILFSGPVLLLCIGQLWPLKWPLDHYCEDIEPLMIDNYYWYIDINGINEDPMDNIIINDNIIVVMILWRPDWPIFSINERPMKQCEIDWRSIIIEG